MFPGTYVKSLGKTRSGQLSYLVGVLLLLLVTGAKPSQLIVKKLSLEFDKIDVTQSARMKAISNGQAPPFKSRLLIIVI